MKRLLFAVCAVLIVAVAVPTVSNLNAQDLFDDSTPAPAPAPVVADTAEKPAKSPAQDRDALAKKFVELIKSRSEMMTAEELRQAIKAAEAENSRIKAQRELDKVKALLTEIAEKHPNTPAGRAAANGYNAIERTSIIRRGSPFDRALEPVPDAAFSPELDSMFDRGARRDAYERPASSNPDRGLDPFDEPTRPTKRNAKPSAKEQLKERARPSSGSNNDLFGDGFPDNF